MTIRLDLVEILAGFLPSLQLTEKKLDWYWTKQKRFSCKQNNFGDKIPTTLAKFSIQWEPPPPGWLKINFDGYVRNRMASVGFIIRDADGHLLSAGAKNIGEAIMTVAECIAPRHGLAYAIHNG